MNISSWMSRPQGWAENDWQAPDRPYLHLLGVQGYSPTGVIGSPSEASAEKGRRLLDALVEGMTTGQTS